MNNLHEILKQEKAVANMIQQLKKDIVGEIGNTPIEGVQRISPIIAIVKFSVVRNGSWSAEYYIAEKQAQYIEQALEGIKTATAFTKKVEEIIEKKTVRINGNNHAINSTTIRVLEKYKGV